MDIRAYNRRAWDLNVEQGSEWTIPVSPEIIQSARQGQWKIILTPLKAVPPDWFPADLKGLEILCLASGGGQQGPILAAAGGHVTVFDNSPRQLTQDRLVAEREHLEIVTIEGDMADLSVFEDGRFDLIVHPVSNLFIPDVRPVWREAWRVLRPGGILLAGFMNPAFYIFDRDLLDEEGILKVRFPLPYSDLASLTSEALQKIVKAGWPLEFSHTLEDQIGGQLEAGFILTGFYEDRDVRSALDDYMPIYIATRAVKPTPRPSVTTSSEI
jgi:SAM-dependent methyltransferase